MKEREALKLALEALRMPCSYWNKTQFIKVQEAIKAGEEALAQPEQEPFRFTNKENWLSGNGRMWSEMHREDGDFPVYTTPPQRKPLTDEQIYQMWTDEGLANSYEIYSLKEHVRRTARAIEAKLKEKNT